MMCVRPASHTAPLPAATLWWDGPYSAYACTTLEGHTRESLQTDGAGQTEKARDGTE